MLYSCQQCPLIHRWQCCLYMLYTCCQDRSLKPALPRASRHMLASMHATFHITDPLQGEALPLKTADLMTHSAEGHKQASGPDKLEGNVCSKCKALASNLSSVLC